MELAEENQLRKKIVEIENRSLEEELDLIMSITKITNREIAYNLLAKYRNVWEFTNNVSTSGDSFIITLPKKEARERGIKKGTPVLVAVKKLKFFEPEQSKKLI